MKLKAQSRLGVDGDRRCWRHWGEGQGHSLEAPGDRGQNLFIVGSGYGPRKAQGNPRQNVLAENRNSDLDYGRSCVLPSGFRLRSLGLGVWPFSASGSRGSLGPSEPVLGTQGWLGGNLGLELRPGPFPQCPHSPLYIQCSTGQRFLWSHSRVLPEVVIPA